MVDATLQVSPVPYLPWLRLGACQAQRKHSQTVRRRPCTKVFHMIVSARVQHFSVRRECTSTWNSVS